MFTEGYIGITTKTVEHRWQKHKSVARNNLVYHKPLYQDIRKLGAESFIVDTLVEGSLEYVTELERKLRPTKGIGYNVACGGQNNRVGMPHTEKAKTKMREAKLGKKLSQDHKNRIGKAGIGRVVSDAARQSSREKQIGKVVSQDAKDKRLNTLKAIGRDVSGYSSYNSDGSVWAKSQEFYDFFKIAQCGSKLLAKNFDYKVSKVRTIYESFKAGWNPHEDEKYLKWLNAYKETNGTSANTPNRINL